MTIYRASPRSSFVVESLCGKVANRFPAFFSLQMTRPVYLVLFEEIFTENVPGLGVLTKDTLIS
jgi:hypothetical protein